jgi:hypothetical protein
MKVYERKLKNFLCEIYREPCKTAGKGAFCLECNERYFHFEGNCFLVCPNESFTIEENMTCSRCHTTCKKCTGPLITDCSECEETRILQRVGNSSQGSCKCVGGHFEAGRPKCNSNMNYNNQMRKIYRNFHIRERIYISMLFYN